MLSDILDDNDQHTTDNMDPNLKEYEVLLDSFHFGLRCAQHHHKDKQDDDNE